MCLDMTVECAEPSQMCRASNVDALGKTVGVWWVVPASGAGVSKLDVLRHHSYRCWSIKVGCAGVSKLFMLRHQIVVVLGRRSYLC